MAENLTTDSASTTATPSPAAPVAPSPTPTSSTTAPAPPQTPQADAAATPPATDAPAVAEGGTLLTPAPDAETPTEPKALTAEEQTAADAKAALFGAPEGDYEIKGLPEGTVIDTEALAALTPIAKELGLSNDGASKLAAVYAEQLPRVTQAVTDQIMASTAETIKEWATTTVAEVASDPVYGGKPLAEVQTIAAKAIDRFGGPEFREYLKDTGLGNHPAAMRAWFTAGSMIAEDTTFERGGPTLAPKSRTEKYYPTTT